MVGIVIVAFLAGLAVGSFATAVAQRVPPSFEPAFACSECPACGEPIRARDNLPLLSWLLRGGRARCCGARIPLRYPLTELAVGLLFAATVLVYRHDVAEAAIGLVFATVLVVVALTDLEQRIIPDEVLIAGALLCLAIALPTDPSGLPARLIAAAAAGFVFLLLAFVSPIGVGLGDVKLAATMGLFLGLTVGTSILAGLLFGSIFGLILIARHGADARKMAIPLGPFLALGGVIGLLAGERLLDLYWG